MAHQWFALPQNSIVHGERYLRCLRELHTSIVNFTCSLEAVQISRVAKSEAILALLDTFQELHLECYTHEPLRHLNWKTPGQKEFETISYIRKRMKEVIDEESFKPLQLLKDVLSHLWTFLLFNQGDGAKTDGSSSQYLEQEWATIMSDRGLEETCVFVANTFQHEKESLQANGTYKGTVTLNKALGEIIDFLKKITQPSETPISYADDRAMEELHWIPAQVK